MDKLKTPDGVEITKEQELNPWLTGVIGAGLGYWFAKYHGDHGGNGNCGGYGGHGGNAGSCSENCLVNRYELSQAEKIAALQMELGSKNAQLYTDAKIAYSEKEIKQYIDYQLTQRDVQIGKISEHQYDLTNVVSKQGAEIKGLYGKTNDIVANTDYKLAQLKQYCDAEFLHQPNIQPCCKGVEFSCCPGGPDDK